MFEDIDSTIRLVGWDPCAQTNPEVTCEMFEKAYIKEVGNVGGTK